MNNEDHVAIIIGRLQQYEGHEILLLRNPMDLVFAFPNWRNDGETFSGSEWDKIVDFVSYSWADQAIRWIEHTQNGTVLFYEKIKGTLAFVELERLLRDLYLQPIDYTRLQCVVAHQNRKTDQNIGKQLRYKLKM